MAQSPDNSCGLVVLEGGLRSAAKLLGKSERQVYRDAKAGKLPFVAKVGSTYVIPRAAWNRWQQDPQGFGKQNAPVRED
jgi:excisionase family DNA binding protein